MSISTYAELKTVVQAWFDDTTVEDNVDTYIDLAEALFNRTLRTREMQESSSLSLDSNGEASLPADFLSAVRVTYGGSPSYDIGYASPQVLRDYNTFDTQGLPGLYTIDGSVLRVRPTPGTTVTLEYFQKIPALSDSQTTNWLLTRAPDLYLVATEAQHAWKTREYERYDRCMALTRATMQQLAIEDEGARSSNAVSRVKGITP